MKKKISVKLHLNHFCYPVELTAPHQIWNQIPSSLGSLLLSRSHHRWRRRPWKPPSVEPPSVLHRICFSNAPPSPISPSSIILLHRICKILSVLTVLRKKERKEKGNAFASWNLQFELRIVIECSVFSFVCCFFFSF